MSGNPLHRWVVLIATVPLLFGAVGRASPHQSRPRSDRDARLQGIPPGCAPAQVHGENTHHRQRIQAMEDQLAQLDRTYDSRMATANNEQERRLAKQTDDQHRLRLNRAIAIAHQLYACRLDWITAGCPASRVLECYQKLPPDAPADWRPPPASRAILPKNPTDANIPGEIDPDVPVSCATFKQAWGETLDFAMGGTPVPGHDIRGTEYDREKYAGCYGIKKTIGALLGEADVYLRQACGDDFPGTRRPPFDAQRSPTLEVRLILVRKLEAAKGLALVVGECVEQVRKGYAPGPPIPR